MGFNGIYLLEGIIIMVYRWFLLDDPIVDGDFFPRILADLFVVASISMQGGAPVR